MRGAEIQSLSPTFSLISHIVISQLLCIITSVPCAHYLGLCI